MADISTTNLDAGADSPRLARTELLATVQRVNDLAATTSGKGSELVADIEPVTGAVAINLRKYILDSGQYSVMGFVPDASKAAIRAKTSTTDISAYVQDALDAAIADDRGLMFPRGRYVAPGLVVNSYSGSGLRIDGAGAVIRLGANETGLSIIGSERVYLGRGLRFDSTAASGLSQIGVLVTNSARLEIAGEYELLTYGVQVASTKTGISTGAYPIPLRLSPIVRACAAGVYCAATGEYVEILGANVTDCTLYGAVIDAGNVKILGGQFSGNDVAIQYDGSNSTNGDHGAINAVTVNHNAKAGIVLKNLDYSMIVEGCNIWAHIASNYSTGAYATSFGLLLQTVKNVVAVGNVIGNNKVNIGVDGMTTSRLENILIADSGYTTHNIKEIAALTLAHGNHIKNTYQGTLVASANNNDTEQYYTPTLTNSWVNFGGGYTSARYWRDALGVVHLEGTIKSGTIGTVAMVLPAGFRPAGTMACHVLSNDALGRVTIETNGQVTPAIGSNTWVSLDGISFKAAA
jgi:hypothetical protein